MLSTLVSLHPPFYHRSRSLHLTLAENDEGNLKQRVSDLVRTVFFYVVLYPTLIGTHISQSNQRHKTE